MVKVLYAVGFLLFITGACGIESDGNLMLIFGALAIIGMVMAIIGWRCEVETKRKAKAAMLAKRNRLDKTWACYLSSNLLAGRSNGSL